VGPSIHPSINQSRQVYSSSQVANETVVLCGNDQSSCSCRQHKTVWFVIYFKKYWQLQSVYSYYTTPHNCFTALFLGPPGWAGARRELLDFMVQGNINWGRHTDHPAGRHSIRTNQWPPLPSPHFLQARCPSCRPTNSVKALKSVYSY